MEWNGPDVPTSSPLPFTAEQIQEWSALGPPLRHKPKSRDELKEFQQRKSKQTTLKKQLAESFPKSSEKAIERELNRLIFFDPAEQKNSQQSDVDRPAFQCDNQHVDNTVDHRPQGGPHLQYLWSESEPPLQGQTLYLGGEVGSDGNIYCIPGHASQVLQVDPTSQTVRQIGPHLTSNGRLYKWLRGVVVGDVIYGLPCHASTILRIDVAAKTITKIPIPYEASFFGDDAAAQAEEKQIWKYHGGAISPLDGCIYAIPQRALHVLKFDPKTETASFVGPPFEGRCKWYGGIVGKQDGAIYGVPQNASGVLRVTPTSVTTHGDFGSDNHKWHGGAAAGNGVIVCVPANSDSVLCITPGSPEPTIHEIGQDTVVQSCGRHRADGKYKYLGAMCGTNGKVYIFPCASERVLQVDTNVWQAKSVGPNLRDTGMETVHQNKWQNGLTCAQDNCVYGMPLSGKTLLRIDCSKQQDNADADPTVTTWALPSPRVECRDKFEGGVMTASGVMYTVPNNHKAVLRIVPTDLPVE